MYEIQVARLKLSDFLSSSKFLNTNQMLICPFPSKFFYALHSYIVIYWNAVRPAHTNRGTPRFKKKTQIRRYFERYCYLAFETLALTASFSQSSRGI